MNNETEYMTTVAIATGLSWRTLFNILKLFTLGDTYLILQDSMIGLVDVLTLTPLIEQLQIVHTFYKRCHYPTLTVVWKETKEKGVVFLAEWLTQQLLPNIPPN